ncbi:hypothetical protein [Muriicola sp. E247]|uniref:hypothetical protein n=1 Tax=Muriicola sp. E247 TaxID=3242730 RepID=UPI0035248B2E
MYCQGSFSGESPLFSLLARSALLIVFEISAMMIIALQPLVLMLCPCLRPEPNTQKKTVIKSGGLLIYQLKLICAY